MCVSVGQTDARNKSTARPCNNITNHLWSAVVDKMHRKAICGDKLTYKATVSENAGGCMFVCRGPGRHVVKGEIDSSGRAR